MKEGRTILIPNEVRNVFCLELSGHLLCPRLIAAQNDFTLGTKTRPALDSIPLNDIDVARKRLGNSKDS